MSIEINGVNNPRSPATDPAQGSPQAEAAGVAAPQPADATSARSGDTVALTDAAQQLARLESQIREQPVVDTQRVQQVREALDEGTYRVDARGVAEKLLQFEAYLPNG